MRKLTWDDDMLETLRTMRAAGKSVLTCAERIGVSYPVALRKARELGIAERMNRSRRSGTNTTTVGVETE
jgi:hypothetical protein